jgi:hypothetical protein
MGSYKPCWESPSEAKTRLAKLTPGYAANRLASELREGIRMLGGMPDDHPKVLHVISDFQRSALAGVDQLAVPANLDLRVNKVGPLLARNRGLAVSIMAAGASHIRLYAFNDGTSGKVAMIENGKKGSFDIVPGQSSTWLTDKGAPQSWVDRKLVIEEEDTLAADNVAYDVFQRQDVIPVWLYEPRVEAKRPTFGRPTTEHHIYEQSTYYLNAALQPAFAGESRSESCFQPALLNDKDLSVALAALGTKKSPRLLFIPATATIPPELVELAKAMTARGGAVVFFSGPALVANDYQTAFGSLLPVNIGAVGTAPSSPALALIDDHHPLWGGLDTQTRRQLAKIGLRERNAVELLDSGRALAYYSDAMPFIAERQVGPGRVYFVNTTADRGWSDWPADPPLFVPAIHLLATRAMGLETFAPANPPFIVGERGTMVLDPIYAGKTVRLGQEQRVVDETGRVSGVVLTEPGLIDVTLDDGTVVGRLAANFPPSESVLESYAEPVVLQRLASLRQAGSKAAVRWAQNIDLGSLAWKLCLVLAAMLLLIEPVMANVKVRS